LIQILCIKEPAPVGAAFAAAKARGVNRARGAPERPTTSSGGADSASQPAKNRESSGIALYRAVTLSGLMPRELGKVPDPCMHVLRNREDVMTPIFRSLSLVLGLMVGAPALADDPVRVNPTDPQPTCNMCPGTYIPLAELESYTRKALAEKLLDQQVRDVDIGKAHIGIGMVHRGRLEKPNPDSVAEHDHVSEVYHVISGAATLVLGPDIVNRQRRPATMRTVVEFNGPGNNGSEVRNGIAYEIKAGDVVVIPAGTGHWFTRIEDHIDYLMVRIDPDKLTPLKSEAQSQDYLSKPAKRGE
jgi:mannose-6-phosphate isomerase-like protein (cupin superfamily)